jgi:hypothetical protein
MTGRKPGGLSFRAPPEPPIPDGPRCLACTIALSIAVWALLILGGIHLIARLTP